MSFFCTLKMFLASFEQCCKSKVRIKICYGIKPAFFSSVKVRSSVRCRVIYQHRETTPAYHAALQFVAWVTCVISIVRRAGRVRRGVSAPQQAASLLPAGDIAPFRRDAATPSGRAQRPTWGASARWHRETLHHLRERTPL